MANEIDIIASQTALAGLEELIKKLDVADRLLIKAAQDALTLSQNVGKVTTPSGLASNSSSNAGATANVQREAQQTKVLANEINNLNNAQKKYNATKATTNKLSVQEKVDAQIALNNAKQQARAVSQEADAYQKLSAQLLISQRNAQNLGATFGASSKEFKRASEEVQKLDKELKAIDTGVGKYNRNVGNYASGWNGLGNSINQLTREAPAFAVSLNTGFLALSNNLPILYDEINKLRLANIELAKSGEPTKSVFKQLSSAIFSWGTALSLGVLLLTLYGGTLIDSITGSKKKKEALEKEKKALEEKTKAEQDARDAIASVQAVEVSRSKILLETAKNTTLSYKQRVEAVKELQERYPDYLAHLSKEQILAGETANAENELNNALINRGKALAAQNFLQTNLEKQLSLEIELTKLNSQKFKYDQEASKRGNKIIVYTDMQKQAEEQKADVARKSNKEAIEAIQERLRLLRNEQSYFIDVYNENAKYLDVVKETNKAKKDSKDRDDIDSLNSYLKVKETINAEMDKNIERLEMEAIINRGNNEVYDSTIILLDKLKKIKKELNGLPSTDVKILGATESKEELKELSEEAKKFAKTFTDEFANNSGFRDTFKILRDEMKGFGEDWKTTFLGVAEIAQETFNFVTQLTQKNFDAEKQRLQDQYDVALKYSGDNKEAQEKLAEDLEKQKRDIATREAKAKKKQALVNIAIDTAQAIIGLWANPGFPAAIPLALVVGGLGLAQAAIVNATEIPQYYMGGVHEGGKMMINDGGGSNWKETFVTPDGKVHQSNQKNAIIDAPAGTEIFTHDQWLDKQREISLQNMLKSNNINMFNESKNQGMTKDDFYEVMSNTLGGQVVERSNLDANGFSKYTIKRGNITRRNISRANGKSNK